MGSEVGAANTNNSPRNINPKLGSRSTTFIVWPFQVPDRSAGWCCCDVKMCVPDGLDSPRVHRENLSHQQCSASRESIRVGDFVLLGPFSADREPSCGFDADASLMLLRCAVWLSCFRKRRIQALAAWQFGGSQCLSRHRLEVDRSIVGYKNVLLLYSAYPATQESGSVGGGKGRGSLNLNFQQQRNMPGCDNLDHTHGSRGNSIWY